jgi:predicted DNA-binding transcriptional regulator YafY
VLLKAHADDLDAAARMLASLGWRFTVREPPELRDALRKVAEIVSAATG